jgi:threonine dehydratase
VRQVRVPTADDVVAASDVVARHLAPTPVVAGPALAASTWLKLETLQPTGSFKVRGAIYAVDRIVAEHAGRRIVTASAGNHGLGVAFAATLYGTPATIVIPETASAAKRAALRSFAVELVEHGESYDDAEQHALDLAAGDAHFVSAYNDPDTIAGQGSIALELLEQVPELETIVVPVGGGGLLSGVALAASTRPGVSVIGVDAAASPAVSAAVHGVSHVDVRPTLADGLAGNLEPGSITVDIARTHVSEFVSVDEDEIAAAMVFLAREHGLVVEGSGAVGVAAIMHGKIATRPGATAVLLTGRNIALDRYVDVIRRAATT